MNSRSAPAPAGLADQPRVQADRHHLRLAVVALARELVEAAPAHLDEVDRPNSPAERRSGCRCRRACTGRRGAASPRPRRSTAGRRCRRRSRRGSRPPRRAARACSRWARSGSTSRAAARRMCARSTPPPSGSARAPPRGQEPVLGPAPAVPSTARDRSRESTRRPRGSARAPRAARRTSTLTSYSSNRRSSRHTPARLPYS